MGTNGKRKVGADIANLRQPISTTVTGMKQAINVLNSGTLEAKQVLLNEANVIYECKVCFSMFRSIANLVAHKRTFCRLESKTALHIYKEEDPNDQDDQLVCVEQEDAEAYDDPSTWNLGT